MTTPLAVPALPVQPSTELIQLRRSPSINRSIDNTALDAYMTCPRKFFYSMVLSRRNEGAPPPPLAYGTAWHAGMEAHYKTGGDEQMVDRAIIMAWQPHSKPDDHRTLERCLLEYRNYLKKWGSHDVDCANNGATVGFPASPLVEIPTEAAWPTALHPYAGKIDRIISIQGLFYVEDHKTTSALGATYFNQFDPNNQMMGYAWLAQLLTGLPIAGVRINAHGILKTQSKFERGLVSFSQDRLKEWGSNYNSWVERLERSFDQYLNAIEPDCSTVASPELQAFEILRAFPHNWNACAGKYGPCGYIHVCSLPARVRMGELESKFAVVPWDPMAEEEGVVE